jgi:hypothetical protein
MAAELVQVHLRSGTTVRTCWVEARVKPRDQVTLKNSEDPGRWWDVVRVEPGRRTAGEINRGWNNNV